MFTQIYELPVLERHRLQSIPKLKITFGNKITVKTSEIKKNEKFGVPSPGWKNCNHRIHKYFRRNH